MFTGMDTCIRLLGGRDHVLQVMFLNSLFAMLAVVVIAAARDRMSLLWPRHWRLHLARLDVSYLATIAIFSSYPRLALADAYAILFTSPLLITALSALLLGEHVDWRRWTAVAVGFVGVMVILDAGQGVYSQMIYAIVVGALLFADWPSARVLVGSAIIAASGLYVLHHETAPARRAASA